MGQVPSEEMPKVYRSADVLVLPSRAEGVPRVVLEALACTTPVVTSALPPITDFVSESGYAVEIGDTPGFSERLKELLENPDRRAEYGKRGREIVKERFEWENLVDQTTKVLERLSRG
ncbi:glycosyltransferase family 4 protein [Haloarculaceae archaeon H-GB11]|nr:glycosyltransferase family 4 protein [Haloarculaceae archaeon H-GB11]